MEETKNNQKQALDCDAAIKTAHFRFSLIAPVVQGLVPDASDTAYFMRITKEPLVLSDGRTSDTAGKHQRNGTTFTKRAASTRSCQRPAPTKESRVRCRIPR